MTDILIPWAIATTLLLFVAAYWLYKLEQRVAEMDQRYEELTTLDVEGDTALKLLQRTRDHQAQLEDLEVSVSQIARALPHTIQGLGVMRYNAFNGVGGAQSFSMALVDANGHGVIITGLHGRDDVRVYAKPLENWKSSHSLSAEEQEVLGVARQNL
jgi:uncharacterized protein YlxW (UPF0749 family)